MVPPRVSADSRQFGDYLRLRLAESFLDIPMHLPCQDVQVNPFRTPAE